MRALLLCAMLSLYGVAVGGAAEFESPVRLKAEGVAIRVESPGYACPSWADVDGDGKKELLVGQFAGGKIKVFRPEGDGFAPEKFAVGEWLKAEGEDATVPGVCAASGVQRVQRPVYRPVELTPRPAPVPRPER